MITKTNNPLPYSKKNPDTIKEMFNDIAKNYERGNAILSFQTYRLWNRALINAIFQPHKPQVILDLCCGTGDIAFPYLKRRQEPCTAHMLDFSSGMLHYARDKSERLKLDRHHLHFLEADAQKIPLEANSVDCATVAYGVRNIQNPVKCYEETLRVLRPGGHFGILELTRPANPLLRYSHQLYLKTALPILGKWITSNQNAYQYLCNSIHEFVEPKKIVEDLKLTGFEDVSQRQLFGGIATLITCKK